MPEAGCAVSSPFSVGKHNITGFLLASPQLLESSDAPGCPQLLATAPKYLQPSVLPDAGDLKYLPEMSLQTLLWDESKTERLRNKDRISRERLALVSSCLKKKTTFPHSSQVVWGSLTAQAAEMVVDEALVVVR